MNAVTNEILYSKVRKQETKLLWNGIALWKETNNSAEYRKEGLDRLASIRGIKERREWINTN